KHLDATGEAIGRLRVERSGQNGAIRRRQQIEAVQRQVADAGQLARRAAAVYLIAGQELVEDQRQAVLIAGPAEAALEQLRGTVARIDLGRQLAGGQPDQGHQTEIGNLQLAL